MPKATTTPKKTHYEILNLPRIATLEQIKRAYRKVQLQSHPDKTGDLPQSKRKELEAISKAANAAYEVLSDAGARRKYDKSLGFTTSSHPYGHKPSSKSTSPSTPPPPPPAPPSSPPPRPAPAPPKHTAYPNCLTVTQADWGFGIELSPRFRVLQWGQNYIFASGDHILLCAKLEELSPRSPYSPQKDIRVAVGKTPDRRRITRIESYFKHRMTAAGAETLLWIKLVAPRSAGRCFMSWDFAWDVEASCAVPAGVTNCASSVVLLYEEPGREVRASERGRPHPKGPHGQMLHDRDLMPWEEREFVDLGEGECAQVQYGRNNKMWRLAAFGYVRPGRERSGRR